MLSAVARSFLRRLCTRGYDAGLNPQQTVRMGWTRDGFGAAGFQGFVRLPITGLSCADCSGV